MIILGLAESLKTMNRPDRDAFDGLFLVKYKRYRREILTQPSLKSQIYAIKI